MDQDPVIVEVEVEKPPKWAIYSRTVLTALGGILAILIPMIYEGLRTGQLTLPEPLRPALHLILLILFSLIIYFRWRSDQPLSLQKPNS